MGEIPVDALTRYRRNRSSWRARDGSTSGHGSLTKSRPGHGACASAIDELHPSLLDLLPHEWEVLSLIDGRADLRTIATSLGTSDFDVARIAYGLLSTGVIELKEAPRAVARAAAEAAADQNALSAARQALRERRLPDALRLATDAVAGPQTRLKRGSYSLASAGGTARR